MQCNRCGSYAINHNQHNRDGSDPNLCDVCYWRKRAEASALDSKFLDAIEQRGGDGLGLNKTTQGWYSIPKGELTPKFYNNLREALSASLGLENSL